MILGVRLQFHSSCDPQKTMFTTRLFNKTVRINWGQSYLPENSDVTDSISPTQKWSCDLLCECQNTKHLCNKFLSNHKLIIFLHDSITTLPGLKMSDNTSYATPLNSRYSSQEMKYNFSAQKKFSTWRQVWPLYFFSQRAIVWSFLRKDLRWFSSKKWHKEQTEFFLSGPRPVFC